jgi:hypothetical protein
MRIKVERETLRAVVRVVVVLGYALDQRAYVRDEGGLARFEQRLDARQPGMEAER